MLETIREFAREQLEASREAEGLRRRHAERMFEIADSAHLSEDDDEPFQLGVALAERDDIRAALDWTTHNDVELAAKLAVALETFWNAHAQEEGRLRLSRVVTAADILDPRLRARLLRVAGNTSFNADKDLARTYWEASLDLCRSLGDDRGAAMVLHRLALYPLDRGDLNDARRIIDESQRLAAGRSPLVEAVNLWMYSEIASAEGSLEEAIALSEQSVARASAIGWSWWVSGQRGNLARLALQAGDLARAEREALASLRIAREDENRTRSAGALTSLAQVARARGDLARAGFLWGCAEPELRRSRHDVVLNGGPLVSEVDPSFLLAAAQGHPLELWDAVAIALGELEPPPPPS